MAKGRMGSEPRRAIESDLRFACPALESNSTPPQGSVSNRSERSPTSSLHIAALCFIRRKLMVREKKPHVYTLPVVQELP